MKVRAGKFCQPFVIITILSVFLMAAIPLSLSLGSKSAMIGAVSRHCPPIEFPSLKAMVLCSTYSQELAFEQCQQVVALKSYSDEDLYDCAGRADLLACLKEVGKPLCP